MRSVMTASDRRDVVRNRSAILDATISLLDDGETPTAGAVAWRAGVARATVYRHYPTIAALVTEAEETRASQVRRPAADAPSPAPLDIPALLDRVAPPQLPEQIVGEAQRYSRARAVALYLVDIGGTRLLRAAGSLEFPEEMVVRLAAGPEIPAEGIEALHEAVSATLPSVTIAPMVVRGRATGALLALDAQDAGLLQEMARHAGIALAMSEPFSDVIAASRRRKETTAAAETQQLCLPPRLARLSGLRLAGDVLPAYENGGNWFDHAENQDGAWIAAVDTLGSGARAAATSAVALGALRAARTVGSTPRDAIQHMDAAIRSIGGDEVRCSAFVARWHATTSTLFWVAAGDLHPVLADAEGRLTTLRDHALPQLATDPLPETIPTSHRVVRPDERILLLSDGVSGLDGAPLSAAALRELARRSRGASPARTLSLIQGAIRDAGGEDLDDDAMIVVLAPAKGTP
ncbi:hypothetical protein C7Y72_10175 [Paraconexibacter algicola]|uniref:HTH tetR-type domain-containing protein n=2 Tax=Paraconexibacter algicola TaxID=2133960 RepID=A0A2T4UL55_9ACTN|nr:hypothetical protein C7Y72_10175 [Paraconexibacter algicola]